MAVQRKAFDEKESEVRALKRASMLAHSVANATDSIEKSSEVVAQTSKAPVELVNPVVVRSSLLRHTLPHRDRPSLLLPPLLPLQCVVHLLVPSLTIPLGISSSTALGTW